MKIFNSLQNSMTFKFFMKVYVKYVHWPKFRKKKSNHGWDISPPFVPPAICLRTIPGMRICILSICTNNLISNIIWCEEYCLSLTSTICCSSIFALFFSKLHKSMLFNMNFTNINEKRRELRNFVALRFLHLQLYLWKLGLWPVNVYP